MIIDVHAHVFLSPRIKYTPTSTPFMSAAEQIAIMDQSGVDKAVILPMCNPEVLPEYQGLNEVLEICAKYPGRFIPFCNVDPRLMGNLLDVTAGHFEFTLNQYKAAGCKGLGEITAKIEWDAPGLLNLLTACQTVGFPITFHTSPRDSKDYGLIDPIGLPGLENTLRRFPALKIFGHSQGFWSEISGGVTAEQKSAYAEGPVTPGGAVVRLMRNHPNLYGDLSANSGIKALTRDPEFAFAFIEEFQDRLLLGLDYCSVENERAHIPWLKEAKEQANISPEAYDKIMYKNIVNILQLDL